MVVNQVPPETFLVPPTAHSPNSDKPVIVYRSALVDRTLEGALDAVETDEWVKGGHWKIAREKLAATPHFHAVTHECYTVLRGTGSYLLGRSPLDAPVDGQGRPVGVAFTARAGDVFTFPVGTRLPGGMQADKGREQAGVTHYVTDTEGDYEIIGFYSLVSAAKRSMRLKGPQDRRGV